MKLLLLTAYSVYYYDFLRYQCFFFLCVHLLPCRRQFDFASREAMDESAEWRRRYDDEFDKASKCFSELEEVSISFV